MISQDKPLQSPRTRPRWLRMALIAGLAVLASAVVIGLRNAGEREQEQVAATEIRKVADTLSLMVGNPDGGPQAVPAIDPTPKATGFYGELERVIKTVAGERLAQHKAYLQDLNDIGMPRLLDAHRLARDTGLVESRMILEQAEHLVPKYQQQSLQVLKDMPALIRSLAIREPEKQKMLTRLDASLAQRNANLEQVWSLEARILREFGQMITLLDDNRQHWYADHDELLFDRNDDLNRFHQHMAAIGKLSAEQEKLGRQQLASILSALP